MSESSEKLRHYRKTFHDCSVLEVRCGTNGFHGGNSGSVAYVKFVDHGGNYQFSAGEDRARNGCPMPRMTFRCEGDAELQTLIDGLRYAADTLESECRRREDEFDPMELDRQILTDCGGLDQEGK